MSPRLAPPRTLTRAAAISVIALSLGWLGACSSDSGSAASSASSTTTQPAAPVVVAGSVVSTAGSTNEAEIALPAPITAGLTELGGSGSGVEWVAVAGDGTTTTAPVDLTGDAATAISGLTDEMNALQSAAPGGRSTLAGLDAIASPAGAPVWVFSPLLDTTGVLDFNQLAFDESPPNVVTAATAAGALPDLTGRDVTFVVTPVAGAQGKLSELQVGYQRAIWEGIATAAGAAQVTFFDGTGTTPGTGTIPPIAVPDPTDKINSAEQGTTR